MVKKSPFGTVAATERLATGEPVTKEPRNKQMSVERLSNQGENKVAKSMDHIASVQKNNKSRKTVRREPKIANLKNTSRNMHEI